jgi:arylsulfatase A-like enzyme
MKSNLTRREFLKLAGLFSLGISAPKLLFKPGIDNLPANKENVLIIVFDALSAYHLSLHGYERQTMPNLAHLAEKAIVYHNHYAGGNYTTPGTASLLTGTYPWSHRAMRSGAGVAESVIKRNIFEAFPTYYRLAYSHNRYAIRFLEQFFADDDYLIPYDKLILEGKDAVSTLFANDEDIASVAWIRALKQEEEGYSYSLFLSQVDAKIQAINEHRIKEFRSNYPRGLPYTKQGNHFLLEQAIDYTSIELAKAPQPFLGYFHFFPPHRPYNTRIDFYNLFDDDNYSLPKKPDHIFSKNESYDQLSEYCKRYDEFLLYVDAEFARLYENLNREGILENTWLVLTSDHGELFERGVVAHSTPLLHQPIIRIPLLIFEPGRNSRLDIYDHTSAIDIMPTLLHLTNQTIPAWVEGIVLPPFTKTNQDRHIFVLDSRKTGVDAPITEGSTTLIRGDHKLIYYEGYEELEDAGSFAELYDLKDDPEEMNNIYNSQTILAEDLLDVIKTKLREVNQPYTPVGS